MKRPDSLDTFMGIGKVESHAKSAFVIRARALGSVRSLAGNAVPAAAAAPKVTLVAGGCGPGWSRGPRGRCVRNRSAIVAPLPGVVRRPGVVAGGPLLVARGRTRLRAVKEAVAAQLCGCAG
jgi:hypothetical protein